MKNIVSALAVFFTFTLPCTAEVVLFNVKPSRAEKDYGIKITSQEFSARQTGVTLEFREDGELKGFTYVEMRIVQGERTLVFAALRTKSENGVATARFDVDPSFLQDCQLTIYQYQGPLGDVAYRMRLKEFLPAPEVKAGNGKPAPETKPDAPESKRVR